MLPSGPGGVHGFPLREAQPSSRRRRSYHNGWANAYPQTSAPRQRLVSPYAPPLRSWPGLRSWPPLRASCREAIRSGAAHDRRGGLDLREDLRPHVHARAERAGVVQGRLRRRRHRHRDRRLPRPLCSDTPYESLNSGENFTWDPIILKADIIERRHRRTIAVRSHREMIAVESPCRRNGVAAKVDRGAFR